MLPGAIAILSPLIIGFIFGPEVLGGFLAGATVSGVLMGMFQNNAGGAWDNAKKSFEKGVEINGVVFYKKSEPHKASVTGDTVGDPFKDTSGPSMNILIKLMSIVSLVIAPTLAQLHKTSAATINSEKVVEIKMTATNNSTDSSKTFVIKADNDNLHSLIEAVKKDGLSNDGNISIDLKDGKLQINGKEVDSVKAASYAVPKIDAFVVFLLIYIT